MKPENVICLESDAFRKLIDSLVIYIKNECTTGNGKNQLQNIKKGGVIDQQYTYDTWHRAITFDQKIDGTSYTTAYQYNTYNDITKITYPQSFAVDYAYNTRGMLTHIYKGGTTNIIYQVNSTNILGQVTGYTLGNGKTSAVTYQNNGMPSNFSTAGVQNLNMVFNMANGNLESRTDVFNGNQTEAFTYETALDRLKTIAYNGGSPVTIDYGGNGNITQKYDAGNYTYDNTKKNAVKTTTLACGITGAQSVNLQNIDYNHFNKPTSIVQNSQTLTFTYNNTHDRIKTQLAASGVTTTRLFVGNYERESKSTGGAMRHIYYIHGPDGLVCIAVKLGTNAAQYFYTYTDHLGSIVSVTNTSGVVQGEQSYDAWGRQRNADNWTDYTNTGTITLNGFVLDRGYTGHQHLKEFGIIHMNGRLYDPIVGRMLNPDNFVQDATSTQAYNRYSYVVNNPLKYTDPSGWLFTDDGGAETGYYDRDETWGNSNTLDGIFYIESMGGSYSWGWGSDRGGVHGFLGNLQGFNQAEIGWHGSGGGLASSGDDSEMSAMHGSTPPPDGDIVIDYDKINLDEHTFEEFVELKKYRKAVFKVIFAYNFDKISSNYSLIVYESPSRILQTWGDFGEGKIQDIYIPTGTLSLGMNQFSVMLFHEFIHVYQRTKIVNLMGRDPQIRAEREFIAYYFTFFPNDNDAFHIFFPNLEYSNTLQEGVFDEQVINVFKENVKKFYYQMTPEKQLEYKLYFDKIIEFKP